MGKLRGAYNCTTSDGLACTIVRFVTQLVKVYTLCVFSSTVWGRLRLRSFYDETFLIETSFDILFLCTVASNTS